MYNSSFFYHSNISMWIEQHLLRTREFFKGFASYSHTNLKNTPMACLSPAFLTLSKYKCIKFPCLYICCVLILNFHTQFQIYISLNYQLHVRIQLQTKKCFNLSHFFVYEKFNVEECKICYCKQTLINSPKTFLQRWRSHLKNCFVLTPYL